MDIDDQAAAFVLAQRAGRNAATLSEVFDASRSNKPGSRVLDGLSREGAAVIRIQALWRGHSARLAYIDKLRRRFDQDEAERERIRAEQVTAGEVLVRT